PATYEERTEYPTGSSPQCNIVYSNFAVSREHAKLHWNGNSWSIIDLNSTNGTYVNGKRINSFNLTIGDVIFIVGLYFIVGNGYIAINNCNNRVSFSVPKIRRIISDSDIVYAPKIQNVSYSLYDRTPRQIKAINTEPIEIETPPMSLRGNNIPLLLRLGSPVLMGGRALMNGNILMAISSMVLPTLTQGLTEKERKEYEQKRVDGYRKYLVYIGDEINKEKLSEEELLNFNYPPLDNVLQLVINKKRLWDRRKSDSDFLKIRLGYGEYPMIVEKEYPKKRFQIETDMLEDEMYALAETPTILNNVPVMLSFVEDFILGINGKHNLLLQMVRNMILQVSAAHSYDEVKIVILVDPEQADYFHFLRYLPHNWNNEKSIRFFITSHADVQQFTAYLNKEREEANSSSQKYDISEGISYVVFALSKNLFNHSEILKSTLKNTKYSGISIIAAFDVLPKECGKIIKLDNQCKIIDYLKPESEEQVFILDSAGNTIIENSVRKMTETKLRIDDESYKLPSMVTFLEMFNAGKVEHINPLERWENNNAVKSLAAPVGIGTDGKTFMLDLHEKFHGPHGLVAGMTGSGKSEFLITYILSMAVNYSPDEVAFVLIDYKGGGLADAFEDEKRGIHLPHLVGTITNLDGASINRSLMSIKSELKRRQAVFKDAKSKTDEGTMDIYDYQKLYRNKRVSEPMPHLIIISDEFAEMKTQQPEFMNELISTARIGRSLGVHLILATQKPAGVVNDQIRSNTKFQVCLRVQDRSDSMDMIKRPDAAELKNTGRFYMQVGYNEFFAQGQSAWCGAEYTPQEDVVSVKDNSVQFVDNVGQNILKIEPEVKVKKTGTKQIVAIVKYLSDLAKREGLEARSLWSAPLPTKLDYDEFMSAYKNQSDKYMKLLLGFVDDPERQNQFPLVIDFMKIHHMFVCGIVASGKTTFIKTMLLEFVEKYSPDDFNYYILDLSSGALNMFAKLPHCGAYLTENNETDFRRLFNLIKDIISERKKLFSDAGVTNYNSYCDIAKIPMIMFIIDGFVNIKNFAAGNDISITLHEILKEAANCGIKFVITANHPNEVTLKSRDELDFRISLTAKDRYEYNDIMNVRCTVVPPVNPGRGLCLVDERLLEYQVAMPYSELDEQNRNNALRKRLEDAAKKYDNSKKAKSLPMVDKGQKYSELCKGYDKNILPLGYLISEMRPIAMPFHQLYSLSIYLGNPQGVKSIVDNLIELGRHNDMDLVIVRKKSDSVFDIGYETEIRSDYLGNITLLNSNEDDLSVLSNLLFNEIKSRNVYRDEYCVQNGIPETDNTRLKQAKKYIRSKTKPLLVILESFGDVCRVKKTEDLEIELRTYLTRTNGYNIYFAACFYPNEDGALASNQLMKNFNKEEYYMLFGGQYSRQSIFDVPMELKRVDKINPNYDKYMLKYRGEWYPMYMPCGEIGASSDNPDDMSII
ncbi:MAG: type VII secretion protein EssC, partial [Clostridiales bacterium]|nr:type VII secretion protein EssC [Clostridiales bacterium]